MKYHCPQNFIFNSQQVSSKLTVIQTLHLLHISYTHRYIKVFAYIEICIHIISHLKDSEILSNTDLPVKLINCASNYQHQGDAIPSSHRFVLSPSNNTAELGK